MDNRLIFLYCRYSIERSGDAGGRVKRATGRARPREIDSLAGKSAGCFEGLTGRENRVPK
jgi:hypothetical protein